jgi:hypothetical protein
MITHTAIHFSYKREIQVSSCDITIQQLNQKELTQHSLTNITNNKETEQNLQETTFQQTQETTAIPASYRIPSSVHFSILLTSKESTSIQDSYSNIPVDLPNKLLLNMNMVAMPNVIPFPPNIIDRGT